jgi:signal transduction histidine kinase/CheY-like chemotaxis protein
MLDEPFRATREEIVARLRDAFVRHAIDNRGLLTSARRAPAVAEQLYELARQYLTGESSEAQIAEKVAELVDQGMALSTAAALIRAFGRVTWPEPPAGQPNAALAIAEKLADFQHSFLHRFADSQARHLHRSQERAQEALQYALHAQLEQQRHLQQMQAERNQILHRILQLNAAIGRAQDETELLDTAVSGVCRTLDLADATILEQETEGWRIRTTTAADLTIGDLASEPLTQLLEAAQNSDGEIIQRPRASGGLTTVRLAHIAQAGPLTIALVLNGQPGQTGEDIPTYIRTFAPNLVSVWQNVRLLQEARQRAKEMEILHGRYVDSIWQTEAATLAASFTTDGLQISRSGESNGRSHRGSQDGNQDGSQVALEVPLAVGEHPFGRVTLPPDANLDDEGADFVQAIVREMGTALNNAYLLQATRSYSNQLRVAADVSRAASTILDRDLLMKEVVELIRSRFELYYVGLFLVDEHDQAVLRAGAGEAGRIQLEQSHKLPVGSHSMIGQAIGSEEARVEQDVTQAKDWRPNPHLPLTRSELALPLRTRGRTIGALTVQSERTGAFSEENITVLQTLADQLATAIENASLFAQIQDTLAEANRLYRAGRQLTEARDPQTVYQTLVDFAAESGLVDLAHIIAPDSLSADHFTFPALWSRIGVEANPTRDRFLREKFPFTDLLSRNELIVVRDGQNDPTFDEPSRKLCRNTGVRGVALVPIHLEDRWLATIALDRVEANPLSLQELQPFLTLADQAAVILANQQLLADTNALYGVSRAMNQAITQDDAIGVAIQEIVARTSADQCRVILYDRERGYGRIAGESTPSGTAGSIHLPMAGDPIFDQLNQRRQPMPVEDTGSDAMPETIKLHLRQFGARSALLVPAITQQELLGFVALDSFKSNYFFRQEDINFAQAVTDQLTTAIESIRRYEEALRRAQELITLNQIGARISGTLDLNELALVVHEQVGLLLEQNAFVLSLYDNATNLYRPLIFVADTVTYELEPRQLKSSDRLFQLLRNGMPLLADATTTRTLAANDPAWQLVGRMPLSSLWIPLQQEGIPTGLLAVLAYNANAYHENELQLLRSVATQAGLAISNAQLFLETQENVAELRLLFSITQAAAASIDAGERIQNMITALHTSLGSADVSLMIASDRHLDTIASAGMGPILAQISASEGLVGQVMSLGQPIMINDLDEIPDYQDETRHILSQLVVPLNLGRRTIGVINVESIQREAFTERDLRLLQTLSVSLASTLESGRLFRDIQAANEQLRELDRLKTQFLANMSHELRTPLNSIIGFSRVILKGIDGPVTKEQVEDLTSIHNSGQHLLRLINDILDLAKIEAGKIAMAFETVDLNETAESVMSTARGLIKDKPIKLYWDVEPDLPLIEADPIRLRQILINFLSNAAKFTEEGEIRLQINRHDHRFIQITVKDTGMGIDEADYDKLFKAFEQVDSSATRTVGGTGLGLPITKKLVEMHGGQIWFESEIGRGSTFHVTLPIHQEGGSAAAEPDDDDLFIMPALEENGVTNGKHQPAILIVEDEPGVTNLYERYLRSQPFRLLNANDGSQALDALRQDHAIRLVLLDINLPEPTGWEILKQIRQDPATAAIPVVICSIEADPQKAQELGAQLLLPKPIVEDDLLTALKQVGVQA